MDEKYVCPCGLVCSDCLAYKPEIYDAAQKLYNIIKKEGFDKYLMLSSKEKSSALIGEHFGLEDKSEIAQTYSPFKNIDTFMEVLDKIIKFQCKETCREGGGCSMGGHTRKCTVLKCIESQKIEGCWECDGYDRCDRLKILKNFYGRTIEENLTAIKEKGINSVQSRGNGYYTWQVKHKEPQ